MYTLLSVLSKHVYTYGSCHDGDWHRSLKGSGLAAPNIIQSEWMGDVPLTPNPYREYTYKYIGRMYTSHV